MNVSLPAELENFVQSLVLSGSYSGPDEVVGKALLMFKRREELRREIQVGIDQLDRGEFVEYDDLSLERFTADVNAAEETLFGQDSSKS